MNRIPRQVLRQLFEDYGPILLDEPERVSALLADLCGSYRRERFLLIHALQERIPFEIQKQPQGDIGHILRLSQRLQKRYGFSAEAAQWAVESWSLALKITAPEQDMALIDKPFAEVEEIMLQILEHEPMTSREVATILKTEQQSASAWLEELQNAGKIERKWLKQRSRHYPCYQSVSAGERLSAEVAARQDLEKQVKAEVAARQNAELRTKKTEAAANRKAEERIAVEVAARRRAEKRARTAEAEANRKAEKRARTAEEEANRKAKKQISIEVEARMKAERRAVQAEELAKSSPPTQRQTDRQWQNPRPNLSQKQANNQPKPAHASTSPAKKHSTPSKSKSGCVSLVALLGLLGLLTLLGSFFL